MFFLSQNCFCPVKFTKNTVKNVKLTAQKICCTIFLWCKNTFDVKCCDSTANFHIYFLTEKSIDILKPLLVYKPSAEVGRVKNSEKSFLWFFEQKSHLHEAFRICPKIIWICWSENRFWFLFLIFEHWKKHLWVASAWFGWECYGQADLLKKLQQLNKRNPWLLFETGIDIQYRA